MTRRCQQLQQPKWLSLTSRRHLSHLVPQRGWLSRPLQPRCGPLPRLQFVLDCYTDELRALVDCASRKVAYHDAQSVDASRGPRSVVSSMVGLYSGSQGVAAAVARASACAAALSSFSGDQGANSEIICILLFFKLRRSTSRDWRTCRKPLPLG